MGSAGKMVEKSLMIVAGVMVVLLVGIVCYKMGESGHVDMNVSQYDDFNKSDGIRRLEVRPTVQFTVNVKSEDLKGILNNASKDVTTNGNVQLVAESGSAELDVSTNVAKGAGLELAMAEQEKRYNEIIDLFRRYAYTMDLWQNRNRSDEQIGADDKMFMLINGDGEYEIELFEFTMEGVKIKTAYEFGQADMSKKDVSDELTSMVANKNALILARRKIYFWKPNRVNSIDCSVPVSSEKLNPAAEELGALYEFMKEARRLPLLYQVSFKAENEEKAININTFPFSEKISRSVFEQRVKRYLSDRAIAAEKERLKQEYAEKSKGLNKRRVVFGTDKKIITRLDGTIEVPRRFFWDNNRGWGIRLGTHQRGQEKEQQRYERWVQLVDEAKRQEEIVKELKALDRNINRNVNYMSIDRLDVEDMLNRGRVIVKSILKK